MILKEEILSKITPKNDVIFKKIFGARGNEGILKSFLESILDIEIESLVVDLGTELLPDFYDGKLSRLDVRATLNDGTIVNIEVQTNMHDYTDKRSLAYWSKVYLEQFKQGQNYKNANKTICIWILDGQVYDFPEYHSKWKVAEVTNGQTKYFDDFEIHVIELQKFRKLDIIEPKKKEFWLWFIDHTKKEMVEMSSYTLEEIKKAKAEYEKMIAEEPELQHFLMREEFAAMDRAQELSDAREKGIKEGKEEGLKEGLEAGKKEGLQVGKKEEKLETAKKMLEKGIDIKTIAEITGLTEEEIRDVR